MRSVILLALVSFMLVPVAAACGGKAEDGGAGPDASSDSPVLDGGPGNASDGPDADPVTALCHEYGAEVATADGGCNADWFLSCPTGPSCYSGFCGELGGYPCGCCLPDGILPPDGGGRDAGGAADAPGG
jgi:hypothetical protein